MPPLNMHQDLQRRFRVALWGWILLFWGFEAAGQTLPIELRLEQTRFNYKDQRGVPISPTVSDSAGSNGQQPTTVEPSGLAATPTAGQFRTLLSFGAVTGLKNAHWKDVGNDTVLNNGVTPFSVDIADKMKLPRSGTNILRRAWVAAPYFGRKSAFLFGAVIPPPVTDENGAPLPAASVGSYWLPQPFLSGTNTDFGSGYYWSPHSRQVFASQSGPVKLTWIKSAPTNATDTYVNLAGTQNHQTNGTDLRRLRTETYLVSGAPVQTPRKIYWTEGDEFSATGVPITVPGGRIGAIQFIYNSYFPETVPAAYQGIGQTSFTAGSTNQEIQNLRTLWYESGHIRAFNAEGRVLMEVLGEGVYEPTDTNKIRRVHLGVEVVDVIRQPTPHDVTVELGERIVPPENESLDRVVPVEVEQEGGTSFAYKHFSPGNLTPALYAVRQTVNLNDYLLHWMEKGVAGLEWPKLYGRYQLVWPSDVAKYSHYVRPPAPLETDAMATAVVLNSQNAPFIASEDIIDFPRAKFSPQQRFYTWLGTDVPAHRTLLRFNSGDHVAFERVFSWLDLNLRTTNGFAGSVATNLTAWNSSTGTLDWPDELKAPRVVNQAVHVGTRIIPPAEEPGSPGSGSYLAGFINIQEGNSYNPQAYRDPFVAGFANANLGAIIPVNSIPGSNVLEVWWFRPNSTRAGLNAGNKDLGFSTIYWPSFIGRYTLQWPANPREIVLASRLGGTGLSVSEQLGKIYVQNDPALIGYNPNEEHAIMSGGTPFATRDDLNIITNVDGEYSSHPFVLVDYKETDGRPAMAAFKVLREKPEAGWVFDYLVPAGQMIQPPPPLNFLAKPVEGSGGSEVNYNTEPPVTSGDLPGGWTTVGAAGSYKHYRGFTYKDRKNNHWVYRGPHAGLPALQSGTYDAATRIFHPLTNFARARVDQQFNFTVHASRQEEFLVLDVSNKPAWMQVQGLRLTGVPTAEFDDTQPVLTLVVRDLYDGSRSTNTLEVRVQTTEAQQAQAPLALLSTNSHTQSIVSFTNRPPFLGMSPDSTNSFTLRYYYKTEPGFAWPGFSDPPKPGSIVPYLRAVNSTTGGFVGAADSKNTESLNIVYRPFWPVRDPKDSSKAVPVLPFGATLAEPAFNLPGVRDFKTAHVLYQQSIASNISSPKTSAILHDPTRGKFASVVDQFPDGKIPGGVKTTLYQGKYFFPNLPPHLATRLYIDPNRGSKGSLVLIGEYKKELLGESYLQLNVLRGKDLQAALDLCPTSDAEGREKWEALVQALQTSVESFHEDENKPGTFVPDTNLTKTYGEGDPAEVVHEDTAVDSYAISAVGPGSGYITVVEAGGKALTEPGDPVAMHIFKVGGPVLHKGELKVLTSSNPLSEFVTFQHTADLAGKSDQYEYEWKIAAPVDGFPPEQDATMSRYLSLTPKQNGLPLYVLGGSGIQVLGDNYVVMRYRPTSSSHPLFKSNPTDADWSPWTAPALAEGWIKRVLAGINPFNQRISDLFNNRVNTDASILTQAGRRWEGDVALNLDTINNYGLIEIYETVLRRGRSMSIESGFNYGPANDALLLAAGYLNDLYMMLGNEAWADAANPTIGIGTSDNTYGSIATALFAFKGQMPTLLEEELALLRGRDDFFLPGVEVQPVYNRMVWNYTRGIDSGEVIYALNYNIQENPDNSPDGVINAGDAARMFPQGHGDAYGHYLTSIKGYYSLLMNSYFDWVPRVEAVNVLGQPVSVDYQDERKFAAAAAATARAGRQVFDLTWRKDYQPVSKVGWSHLSPTRQNTQRSYIAASTGDTNHPVRHWGVDQWASRVGQGTYLNWLAGNAILPDVDPIPTHEGIQKVDRTTVPELKELTVLGAGIQTALDNAEGGLSPLGVPEEGLAFDLNPNAVVGGENGTHFEQIYQRSKGALNNAVAAFDDAKDVTRLMRSEEDSLAELQSSVARQEVAYQNALIDLYGTPYPDDIGPGKLYKQGYEGPDLIHYAYVELPEYPFSPVYNNPGLGSDDEEFVIDIVDVPEDWAEVAYDSLPDSFSNVAESVSFRIGRHGFFEKPTEWKSRRKSVGRIQQLISEQIAAHTRLRQSLFDASGNFFELTKLIVNFEASLALNDNIIKLQTDLLAAEEVLESARFINEVYQQFNDAHGLEVREFSKNNAEGLPRWNVVGTATGGDLTFATRLAILNAGHLAVEAFDTAAFVKEIAFLAYEKAFNTARRFTENNDIAPLQRRIDLQDPIYGLGKQLYDAQGSLWRVNERLREYEDKQGALRTAIAEGDRIQAERETFRRRSAVLVQGFRTRDAAFRIFRNEKLERYKTLFDLSSRYALLVANAYDYETGLLNTAAGRDFVARIVNSRALGVVRNGEPQFAGSNTGDPGLSSALAEMKADWDVVRGRLGFNNPDAYGTTASLRTELMRILPNGEGDVNWKDALNQARVADILEDSDVRRYCMQVDPGNGVAVPGIILTFSTTIADGLNLFGQPLAAGDHYFSPSSFATKIFGVGVALEGYRGMDKPSANHEAVAAAGGTYIPDPSPWFLDAQALAATPYVYLIPVGVDSMRSPPLGDTSSVRTWLVDDLAIPMPFNVGASGFSTKALYQSADSLSEPLFAIRKHQAFRPVPNTSYFSPALYGNNGTLLRSQFTNNRLVGRSVWNSQWKLVIPGRALLNNPKEGLDRFIQTVKDVKIHFVTYSYSGN